MHDSENRRSFLRKTGVIAAAGLAGCLSSSAADRLVNGRRRLGKLEVSSIGLGCQDMIGTEYASAPRR